MISMLHRNTIAKYMYSSKKRQRKIARVLLFIMVSVAVLSVSTILTGCGAKPITNGEIIGKEYQPQHEWDEEEMNYIGKFVYSSTEHKIQPERYLLHIRQYNEEQHCYQYASIEVSKDDYERYQLGENLVVHQTIDRQ